MGLSKTPPSVAKDFEEIRAQMEERGRSKDFTDHEGRLRHGRGYSLTAKKLAAKLALWHQTGVFHSPFSKGIQTDQLNALVALGVNEAHPFLPIVKMMERQMSTPERTRGGITDWQRFRDKPGRGDDAAPAMTRIYQNFKAMRKLCQTGGYNPKGYKLWQMGCCIDVFVEYRQEGKQEIPMRYVRLNTHSREAVLMDVESRKAIPSVDLSKPTLGPKLKRQSMGVA